MYLSYYGFSREPFQMAPDPTFLYLSPGHRRALDMIRRGVQNRAGLMMLTGGEGLGKTMVLRSAAHLLGSDGVRSLLVLNPRLSYGELLQVIFGQLNLDFPEGEEQFEHLRRLQQHLVEEHHNGRSVALFIDEAQDMPVDTLENLRLLSDMEKSRDKLIQIVLAGRQPDLERRFEAFDLRQLKQRIAYRSALVRLTPGESVEYIKHRLYCALAGAGDGPFSPSSLAMIAKHCRGIPDRINIVCRGALAAGSASGLNPIPQRVVGRVLADFGGHSPQPWLKWALVPAALILLGTLLPYLRSTDSRTPPAGVTQRTVHDAQGPSGGPAAPSIPQFPQKESPARTEAESPGWAAKPEAHDTTADPSALGGGRRDALSVPVTMAHPPKPLPTSRIEGGPKVEARSSAKPASSTPASTLQDKAGSASQTTSTAGIPSAPSRQPTQAGPKAPPPSPSSPGKQARERRSAPSSSPAETGKRAVSPTTDAPAQKPTSRNKTQAQPGRPDPSGIVDWYIGQRSSGP